MTVRMTKDGTVREVNASYGLRLIEQGRAVAVKAPAPRPRKAKQ